MNILNAIILLMFIWGVFYLIAKIIDVIAEK
jgi:hypothetical protein